MAPKPTKPSTEAVPNSASSHAAGLTTAAILTKQQVQTLPPCPLGQGNWKNNPDAWPVNSLMLGNQTYTKAELLTILSTPIGRGGKADASLILADRSALCHSWQDRSR